MKKNLKISLLFAAIALMCFSGSSFGMNAITQNRINKLIGQINAEQKKQNQLVPSKTSEKDKNAQIEDLLKNLENDWRVSWGPDKEEKMKGVHIVQSLYDLCGSDELFKSILEKFVTKDNFDLIQKPILKKILLINPSCISFFTRYIDLGVISRGGDSRLKKSGLLENSSVKDNIIKLINEKNLKDISSKVITSLFSSDKFKEYDFFMKFASYITPDNFKHISEDIIEFFVRNDMTKDQKILQKFVSYIKNVSDVGQGIIKALVICDRSERKEIFKGLRLPAIYFDKKAIKRQLLYELEYKIKNSFHFDNENKYHFYSSYPLNSIDDLYHYCESQKSFEKYIKNIITKKNFRDIHVHIIDYILKLDVSEDQNIFKTFVSYVDQESIIKPFQPRLYDHNDEKVGSFIECLVQHDTSIDQSVREKFASYVTKDTIKNIYPHLIKVFLNLDTSMDKTIFKRFASYVDKDNFLIFFTEKTLLVDDKNHSNKIIKYMIEFDGSYAQELVQYINEENIVILPCYCISVLCDKDPANVFIIAKKINKNNFNNINDSIIQEIISIDKSLEQDILYSAPLCQDHF